jgi:hypothetical protein
MHSGEAPSMAPLERINKLVFARPSWRFARPSWRSETYIQSEVVCKTNMFLQSELAFRTRVTDSWYVRQTYFFARPADIYMTHNRYLKQTCFSRPSWPLHWLRIANFVSVMQVGYFVAECSVVRVYRRGWVSQFLNLPHVQQLLHSCELSCCCWWKLVGLNLVSLQQGKAWCGYH